MVAGRRVACFWVDETDESMFRFRRYWAAKLETGQTFEERRTCPGRYGYCNATVNIGRMPTRRDERGYLEFVRPSEFADRPEWPARCPDCGREFGPLSDKELSGVSSFDDAMSAQVNQEPIYRAADGREWQMDRLPPGAMLDAQWSRSRGTGPDGRCLLVVCPVGGVGLDARNGFWLPDCPSTDGSPWTRTGDPRADPASLTVRPSILFSGDGYHAFLTDGVLADC